MTHKFVIMVNGQLNTYFNYEDIPDKFDHVIEFRPEISAGPHSEDEHEQISAWNDKLQLLIQKETARFGND
jgi:hypothetical protein